MNEEPLLAFEPSALIFQVELNKQLSSSIRLSNNTANTVIYKLLTTSPRNYGVRPKIGVLQPGSVCDIRVTTRLKETPGNKRCRDKFMIRSAVTNPNATSEDARNMFNREAGDVFHECRLRVVYNMPDPSSESSEIDNSPNVSEATYPDIEPNDNAVAAVSQTKLLEVQPMELKVPLAPQKDASCSFQLSNVTEDHVAFKVKTVNSMNSKYLIQPHIGILPPKSTKDIAVKVQVEVPSDVQSEDTFLVQSMVTCLTGEDIQDMFDKASSPIEECEIQVASISQKENDTAQADLILLGIIICLVVLVFCYIVKQTLALIGGLIMVVLMLMIKMVKKLVSDSVEDWVVKTLFHLIVYVCGRRRVLS